MASRLLRTTDNHGFFYSSYGDNSVFRTGQSVLIPTGFTIVSGCQFWLDKFGSPSDSTICNIYNVDGSGLPTGASLGSSSGVLGSSLINTPGYIGIFNFSPAITVYERTKYAFILSRTGAQNPSNFYDVWGSTIGTEYPDGLSLYETSGGWSSDPSCQMLWVLLQSVVGVYSVASPYISRSVQVRGY